MSRLLLSPEFCQPRDDTDSHVGVWGASADTMFASRFGSIIEGVRASGADQKVLRCSKCEIKLEGEEPWEFPGAADDLEIIHTPGHTYGHIVLLHKPSKCGLLPSPLTCLNAVGYPLWVQAQISAALAAR